MKTYQRGGYFNQSQTFHPFYQPEQIKKEELDKILEADSIADDSTIQNAFYDAPTVVYLFAPYTYPNDAQDCCVVKSFTIRQNKPKNPGEICELPGFILNGNILAILQRSYYNKDKFCGKLIFRRKRQKRRLTFKKQKRSVREMAKILISPSKYLQGAGEMKNIGTYAAKCGKKALVLISQGGYRRIGAMIEESFAGSDCDVVFDYFNGECCESEINRLVAIVKEKGCDMVIGVGGGKIFDTAKAVAYYAETPVFICPTIASTDAPCSALSVVYTEEGVFERYLFLPANPNLVLMDTDIIVKSPVRLTVAGMGDALATYFEARACQRSGATSCAGGKTTEAAMALAKLCFDTLMEEGVKAKIALEAGVCTPAVEKVIEANTLLSGIGFESAGLAGAHAIHNGFTVLEECHHMYHGEKVAFGTLTQLVLENVPLDELEDIILWCIEVGLPVTLAELGAGNVTDDQLMEVAKTACAETDTLHNMPFEVTPETVFATIKAADAYGRYYLDEEE